MSETKKGDDRKREFLMTALDLFYEKGYEKTTINDIINRMGVSKGAFYHYFQSKEDVIINIANHYADQALVIMKNISAREDLSVVEKINKLIESMNRYKAAREEERAKIKGVFHRADNLKLERRLFNSIKQTAQVFFRELIDAGVNEGVIHDPVNPRELTDFILQVIHALNSSIDELLSELGDEENPLTTTMFNRRLEEKLLFYEEMLTRILQIREGSVRLREPYLTRFLR